MQLYDSRGDLLGTSNSTGNSQQLSLSGASPGTYFVRVYGYAGATNPNYSLVVALPSTTPLPSVTGVSPATGPTAGGTSVVITGAGFTGATAVTFGGVAATGVVVNSAGTQITAVDPAAAMAGAVDVQVTTPAGTSATGNADRFVYIAPPTVVSVTPEDASGNGAAAGSSTGGQRSMITQFVIRFSEPVTLSAGAFTLGLVNNFGSGANDGSADADASAALGTPTNPSNDGVTWIVPVVQSGASSAYSYNLTGGGASLQDGVYHLNVTASAVTATAGGMPMASAYASPLFHRLFGDTDGNKTINALDYARFKTAFGSGTGSAGYNADLDFDANGTVNAADYAQFKKRFGLTFAYP